MKVPPMRTDALLAVLMCTSIATGCDLGDSSGPDADRIQLPSEADDEVAPDGATPTPAPGSDTITAEPDVQDVGCVQYFVATRENDSRENNCSVTSPEPDWPEIFPWWDDHFGGRLGNQAASTCTVLGAADGNGQLPASAPNEGPLPLEQGIDGLTASGSGPSAAPGGPGVNPIAFPKAKAPTCATICNQHNKVWLPNTKNFGTCAFNLTIEVDPPQHNNNGPACESPGTRRWTREGSVLFDCGCRCA